MELPEGLEEIGEGVFFSTSLQTIVIPPFVKVIGKEAFCECERLTNVELPEGLEEIGEWAFNRCTSLYDIVIPQFVKVIGKEAFFGCSELTMGRGHFAIARHCMPS